MSCCFVVDNLRFLSRLWAHQLTSFEISLSATHIDTRVFPLSATSMALAGTKRCVLCCRWSFFPQLFQRGNHSWIRFSLNRGTFTLPLWHTWVKSIRSWPLFITFHPFTWPSMKRTAFVLISVFEFDWSAGWGNIWIRPVTQLRPANRNVSVTHVNKQTLEKNAENCKAEF